MTVLYGSRCFFIFVLNTYLDLVTMFREHVPADTHHSSCSARHTGDKAQGGAPKRIEERESTCRRYSFYFEGVAGLCRVDPQ